MATLDRANSFYNRFAKRLFDCFLSLILVIVLSPILCILLIINSFFTGFRPLFVQKRFGRNKTIFYIIKLRTLVLSAPNYEEKSSMKDYTGIGFFLRKTHLDELFQLFNIFIGQMSFIGPRPIICSLTQQTNQREIDGVFELRPGLSGLAQINERDKELSQKEKCFFDKQYLATLSFGLDAKIFLKSINVTLVNLFRNKCYPNYHITLMYITNNPKSALVAEKAGVDRIWIDLETLGKAERQIGLDTVQSHHTIDDIKAISRLLTTSKLQVRVNPWNCNSVDEINKVIENGAQYVMLPMWKTVSDVSNFVNTVGGRVKTILLLETKEAEMCLDDVLLIKGIDEIHIGLNDLHLSYHLHFMFELLTNGTVERIAQKIKAKVMPFGFGGFSHIGADLVPAEKIVMEHYRLGSTRAILSRGFCPFEPSNPDFETTFVRNMGELRDFEKKVQHMSNRDLDRNRKRIITLVNEIVRRKS